MFSFLLLWVDNSAICEIFPEIWKSVIIETWAVFGSGYLTFEFHIRVEVLVLSFFFDCGFDGAVYVRHILLVLFNINFPIVKIRQNQYSLRCLINSILDDVEKPMEKITLQRCGGFYHFILLNFENFLVIIKNLFFFIFLTHFGAY